MKVAYITHYLPSYRYNILNKLVNHYNIKLTVYSDVTPQIGLDLNTKRNKVFNSVHSTYRIIQIKNKKFYYQKDILKLLVNNDYDVYIISALKSDISVWLGLIMGKLMKRKIVIWGHCRKNENKFHNLLMEIMFKLSTSIIFYSQDFKLKWNFKRGLNLKSFVAPNTLEINNTLSAHLSYPFSEKHITGIFVGRLIKAKKIDLLLKAIHLTIKKGIFFNMIIIGDGPEKARLNIMCSKLKITKYVIFKDSIFDEKILSSYYSFSDIAVIPSHAGLAINQSFAYGKPVLTDNNFVEHPPEITMITENKTGIFYQQNDVYDFSEKITNLVLNKEKLVEMGKNAKLSFNEYFSPIKMVNGIYKAINYADKVS